MIVYQLGLKSKLRLMCEGGIINIYTIYLRGPPCLNFVQFTSNPFPRLVRFKNIIINLGLSNPGVTQIEKITIVAPFQLKLDASNAVAEGL